MKTSAAPCAAGARLLVLFAVGALLIGCSSSRTAAPAHPPPPPLGPERCGTNGVTYPPGATIPSNVVAIYDGPCLRCEDDPCPVGLRCETLRCPYREGPAAEEECLQRSGPRYCLP